ncbi:MAG: hemolysin family protein [Acidobacteriota bacterium]
MGEALGTLAGVLFLIMLNGLYVAAEFSLVGARRSRLEVLAREGRRGASRMLEIVTDLRRLDQSIATVQVGITCASLGLGMYGEPAVASLLRPALDRLGPASWAASHGVASLLSLAGLTFLHVVLGEVVPKSMALHDPSRMSLRLEPALRLTRWLARPLVVALASLGAALLRLLHTQPVSEAQKALSTEEIETVIEESGAGRLLESEQLEILARLLDFETLRVRQVMVARNQVAGLPLSAGEPEILSLLASTRHSRYPVYRKGLDDIIGYVHVKDLMRAMEAPGGPDLGSLCLPVPRIPETAPCTGALGLLRRQRAPFAVALDEHGGTAGMVTLVDLMEEIVGDLPDEAETQEPLLRPLAGGGGLVNGTCRLDELNQELGLSLEEEQVDTVAGLILKHLGRMARRGDIVQVGNVRFLVDRVDGLAITRVLVNVLPVREGQRGPGSR